MDEEYDSFTVTGHVKWYDIRKGYGFILVDGLPDVLLHGNVLRNFGQTAVSEQAQITATVRKSSRGYQVEQVLSLGEGQQGYLSRGPMSLSEDQRMAIPIQPARVKWFQESLGFGFVNVFGINEDVFFHADVLRASALGSVNAGDAVGVRVSASEKGPMVIQVVSWLTVVPKA